MDWKHLLFVVNPKAGQKKKDSLSGIIDVFTDAKYLPTLFYTKYSGHATEIVKEHGASFDMIVCMGGDGTLNEVVAGVYETGLHCPIGYIPAGSTNDFAASLSLPLQPVEAAKNIVTGTPHYFDIGNFGDRLFVYTASCGLFTNTSYETPQEFKNLLGHFAYILNGIKDLSKVKRIPLRFKVGSEVISGEYIFVGICNTTSIGGVMNLTNDMVDFKDGVFELILIPFPKDLIELNRTIAALTAKDFNTGHVQVVKVSSMDVENAELVDWSVDGEKEPGSNPVSFHVIHDAIKIVYEGVSK